MVGPVLAGQGFQTSDYSPVHFSLGHADQVDKGGHEFLVMDTRESWRSRLARQWKFDSNDSMPAHGRADQALDIKILNDTEKRKRQFPNTAPNHSESASSRRPEKFFFVSYLSHF